MLRYGTGSINPVPGNCHQFPNPLPRTHNKEDPKKPPRSQATEKGHMNAQRANLLSTKTKIKIERTNNAILTPTIENEPSIIKYDPCGLLAPKCTNSQDLIPRVTLFSVPPPRVPIKTPMIIPDDSSTTKQDLPNVPIVPAIETPLLPVTIPNPNKRLKYVYASCIQMTGQIHTDQTRKFLVQSTSGNKYLFVLYDYDSNYIHAEPIPSRTKF